MAESGWSGELAKLGYEAQQKFDFYAVALAFTILGLAIQTAEFGANPLADLFELLGWLALLVSGVAGLHRLEWQPHVFQLHGLEASQQDRLAGLRKARAQGAKTVHALDSATDLSLSQVIARDEEGLRMIQDRINEISGRAGLGYKIRSVTLLLGLASLMIARGLDPLLRILNNLFGAGGAA